MKCYTIIDSFDGGNELWVANYANEDSARKCFTGLLNHYGVVSPDGEVKVEDDWTPTIDELFHYLLENGCSYTYYYGSESGNMFIRAEEINDEFKDCDLPF